MDLSKNYLGYQVKVFTTIPSRPHDRPLDVIKNFVHFRTFRVYTIPETGSTVVWPEEGIRQWLSNFLEQFDVEWTDFFSYILENELDEVNQEDRIIYLDTFQEVSSFRETFRLPCKKNSLKCRE